MDKSSGGLADDHHLSTENCSAQSARRHCNTTDLAAAAAADDTLQWHGTYIDSQH